MAGRKRIVLQPEYIKDFNCIGSKCEDSCCIGWKVNLDKKTYLSYKNMNNPELKLIIQEKVNRNRSQNNEAVYGKINMESEGRCPFLNKENLCKVYIHAGEEYLSDTCTFYPRNTNRIDGKLERSSTVSCPEVTRLALLNPNGIAFEHVEEEDDNIRVNINFDTEGHLFMNRPQRYFWDIRIFSLSLLQNRNYNLGDRLIILGMVYKRIEKLYDEKNMKDLPAMLESMSNLIEDGDLKEELKKVPLKHNIQMSLAKQMTDEKVVQGITSKRYLDCLKETLLGLGYIKGDEHGNIIANYEKACNDYYSPYMEEKEYILENYLVNEYFKEMMPFGIYGNTWDSYIFLCSLYSMVKLHLIGMAGYHEKLNDDLVLKLIQSFSKVVLHNSQYIHHVIKLLKDNEFDSLAYMSILVKN